VEYTLIVLKNPNIIIICKKAEDKLHYDSPKNSTYKLHTYR
jgi:hypothetical protein